MNVECVCVCVCAYLTLCHLAPISLAISPTDNDGFFFLISGRSSCEKRKKADSGRFGALGSLPAFFDEPRGIIRIEYVE